MVEIYIKNIFQHHSMGIKKRSVNSYGIFHYINKPFSVLVKKRNNGIFQLIVK